MRRDEVRRWRDKRPRLLPDIALAGVLGALLCSLSAGTPTWAQQAAEGQSCGGLVCDLGLFGHKTPPSEAVVRPAAPAAPTRSAATTPAPEARTHKARKPKVVVRTAPPTKAERAAAASSAVSQAPAQAETVATTARPAASSAPAAANAGAKPAKDEVYIRANPYTSGLPTPTLIIPIGPAPPQ